MELINIDTLIHQQLRQWPLAAKNYADLNQVKTRTLYLSSQETISIQYNPHRISSSTAKTDHKSISNRPCFLCAKNRPSEQLGLPFKAAYEILVNPFPIFPRHLTIVEQKHMPQNIETRLPDMLELARELNEFMVFYNGPRCGASAPDHFHFQAGIKGLMPIEKEWTSLEKQAIFNNNQVVVEASLNFSRKCLVITGMHPYNIVQWVKIIIDRLQSYEEVDQEPMLNILVDYEAEQWRVFLFPRGAHRPRQYFVSGRDQLLLSPGSVDFGGLLITPREEDFLKLEAELIRDIFEQVTFPDASWQQLLKDLRQVHEEH